MEFSAGKKAIFGLKSPPVSGAAAPRNSRDVGTGNGAEIPNIPVISGLAPGSPCCFLPVGEGFFFLQKPLPKSPMQGMDFFGNLRDSHIISTWFRAGFFHALLNFLPCSNASSFISQTPSFTYHYSFQQEFWPSAAQNSLKSQQNNRNYGFFPFLMFLTGPRGSSAPSRWDRGNKSRPGLKQNYFKIIFHYFKAKLFGFLMEWGGDPRF